MDILLIIIVGINVVITILLFIFILMYRNIVQDIKILKSDVDDIYHSINNIDEKTRSKIHGLYRNLKILETKFYNSLISRSSHEDDIINKQNIDEPNRIKYTTARNDNKIDSDSVSEEHTTIINVSYKGEHQSNPILVRDSISEYFYIKKYSDSWRLYVVENILKKRPSQEYEAILNKFFEIEKNQNPNRYELAKYAIVDWNEKNEVGYLKSKGLIKQI